MARSYPSGGPNQSRPSLQSSSLPRYDSQPSNDVPYNRDLGTSPVRDPCEVQRHVNSLASQAYIRHDEPPASRAETDNYRHTTTSNKIPCGPYERLKRKHDEHHRGWDNGHMKQDLAQHVPGQGLGQAGQNRLTYQITQMEPGPSTFPHMPGVARYLQERNIRDNQAPSATGRSMGDLNRSMAGLGSRNRERTDCPHSEYGRLATVQPSKQSSLSSEPILKPSNTRASSSRHVSLKDPMQASNPLYGTQYAPLEISSSPEPETKRRKTAKSPRSVRSNPSEALNLAGRMNYDGLSRQELTKMLAECTDLKPGKVRYYAVAIGREPGVYLDWPSAEKQVHGFFGAQHKKFKAKADALAYIDKYRECNHGAPSMQIPHPTSQPAFDPVYCPDSTNYEPYQPLLQQTVPLDLNQDFAPREDGPKLVPEQQHVVDLIVQGHNVFYTGSAGCGKSTILKAFVRQLQQQGKKVKILAPTNLAALNVGGQTTWNFAGWTPDSMKMRIDKLMDNSRGKESWKKFDETDVLVIDEISMIENLQFERLNMILKASRGEKYGGGAFGGMQLIVTGDFYQLAPVKPFSRCMCGWELEKDNQHNPKEYKCTNKNCREHTFYDIDKWAFRSRAWEECDFKHVNLTQIHRQSDMMFKSILNRIRTGGTILKPHANVLLNHTSETEGAIEIYARRIDVDRVNNENINKIPSAALAYKCLDDFDWPDHHRNDRTLERNTYRLPDGSLSALKEHRFETRVQLKQNQRVVLQANLEPAAGLVNGAQGTIIEFKKFDEKALPKAPTKKGEDGELRGDHAAYRQEQIKEFANANGRQPWPVVRFTNGVTRTIFADCTVNVLGNEEPWCKLSRTQIPLAAGYAITVHKSQGMTLDRVTVDLARAFEPSQIYVALSRARSLKGLTVTALPRFDLGGANAQVKEFMENVVIKKKTESQTAH